MAAARLLTGTPAGKSLPPADFRVATTRGTNALLERNGAPVLLVVTRGFADLLEIRDQRRDLLFSLAQPRHQPLASAVCECGGRLDAKGIEIEPLDENAIRQTVADGELRELRLPQWRSCIRGPIPNTNGASAVCCARKASPTFASHRMLPR